MQGKKRNDSCRHRRRRHSLSLLPFEWPPSPMESPFGRFAVLPSQQRASSHRVHGRNRLVTGIMTGSRTNQAGKYHLGDIHIVTAVLACSTLHFCEKSRTLTIPQKGKLRQLITPPSASSPVVNQLVGLLAGTWWPPHLKWPLMATYGRHSSHRDAINDAPRPVLSRGLAAANRRSET